MNLRLPSFSARTIAIGYAVVTLLVLAMFAAPLWFAWHKNIGEVRTQLLKSDAQHLRNLFERQGPPALAAAIDSQVHGVNDGVRKIMLFAAPDGAKLAGNLPEWPEGVPERDGLCQVTIRVDDKPRNVELVRVTLEDGYMLTDQP